MTDEIRDYIRKIRLRIQPIVPEEDMDQTMERISGVILDNWVNEDSFELKITQVIALVREIVGKGYKDN